tara:strand:+ start:515 stop:682 length:168 start_codon:yes stop_codon:yes gene_type:complete
VGVNIRRDHLVLVVQAETEEPLLRLERRELLAQAEAVFAVLAVLAVLVVERVREL